MPIDKEELTSLSLVAPAARMRSESLAAGALLPGARGTGYAHMSKKFDESL